MTLLDWIPLLAAIAAWMPYILKWYGDRGKTKSETEFNVAQSANEITEGGERAVAAASRMLEYHEKRSQALASRVDEQDKELTLLKAQITAFQIDERAKEARLNAKIEALEQYIKLLIDTLRAHNIDIPPRPEILKESDPKIKVIK